MSRLVFYAEKGTLPLFSFGEQKVYPNYGACGGATLGLSHRLCLERLSQLKMHSPETLKILDWDT